MSFHHLPARAGACLRLLACGLLAFSALATSAQTAPPTPPAATVQVKTFEVQGNTLLSAAVLQERLAEFKGETTPQRLRDAAAAVQELYRRAGYGGVVAFLPEQTPTDGLIRIRVVEGKLSRVDVAENKQFSTANIRASLPALVAGRTPEVRVIDAQIQMANESPAKNVQVLLQPGAEPGTIAAKVTVAELPVQRYTARLDNTGGARTGRWRAAVGWQHANVLDADHVAAAEYQTAPEDITAVTVLTGSYRIPFYKQSAALDVYGAWSNVDAGKVGTAAGDLQFSGKGYIAGLRGSGYLPRYMNIDQRLIAGFEWREYLNDCSISGLPDGACGSAGASVSVQPISLTYTAQAAGEVRWGINIGLHQNLGIGGSHGKQTDFDQVRPGSKQRYTLIRTSAQAATNIQSYGQISARVQAQLSGKALVPGELFGIGGSQNVRGYEERELGGDSGAQLTIELQSAAVPETWTGPLGMKTLDLRAVAFADAGWVKNQQDTPCFQNKASCRLGSLGIGARLSWQQLQARLDVARAFANASTTQKGDLKAHLGLNYNF